jgi:long-subunit acyl-CoA synthetase (AMP-forming)
VAENLALASKYFKLLENGDIDRIVLYGEEVGSNNFGGKVVSWERFLATGNNVDDRRVEEKKARVTPGQCCALSYTSGTTGMPKGVMLSHDNVTFTPKAQQSRELYPSG